MASLLIRAFRWMILICGFLAVRECLVFGQISKTKIGADAQFFQSIVIPISKSEIGSLLVWRGRILIVLADTLSSELVPKICANLDSNWPTGTRSNFSYDYFLVDLVLSKLWRERSQCFHGLDAAFDHSFRWHDGMLVLEIKRRIKFISHVAERLLSGQIERLYSWTHIRVGLYREVRYHGPHVFLLGKSISYGPSGFPKPETLSGVLTGVVEGDNNFRFVCSEVRRFNIKDADLSGLFPMENADLTLHCEVLESSDGGVYPSTSDRPFRNTAILTILALLLLVVAAVLLNYGIWNLYEGPCDWRSTACVIGGWVPFTAGLWILLFRVLACH
jgi:hypothetical protein